MCVFALHWIRMHLALVFSAACDCVWSLGCWFFYGVRPSWLCSSYVSHLYVVHSNLLSVTNRYQWCINGNCWLRLKTQAWRFIFKGICWNDENHMDVCRLLFILISNWWFGGGCMLGQIQNLSNRAKVLLSVRFWFERNPQHKEKW